MPGTSAREMLSRIPIQMANGGTVNLATEAAYANSPAYKRAMEAGGEQAVQDYYANLRGIADKYIAAGNLPTGAEAYNIMLENGISTTDLINAGIGQDVVDKIFTMTEDPTITTYATPTRLESAFMSNPVLRAEAAARSAGGADGIASLQQQARDYLARVEEGGITPEEQAMLREQALEGGYTFQDIINAGIDPSILFNLPVKEEAPPPPPPPETPLVDTTPFVQTQASYTAPTVYQPLPEQPDIYAAGQPALDVAFRESAPRTAIPGMPGFYEYTPAASLRPATGAGMSFRPPSVTSRPRSLLSPTALSFGSASQDYASGLQQQDAALMRAFADAGIQGGSDYYTWRNRLRSGEFGIGGSFDPAAFQSSFSSWAASQPAKATSPTAQGTPLQGGYSDIAENADRFGADYGGGYANFNAAAGSTGPVSGYTIRPVDLRLPPPMYAEGGEVTQSRMMLEQLDADAMAQEPERQESEGLLRNITRGAMDIPSSVGGYLKSRSPIGTDLSFGESASMVFDDLSKIGGAIKEAAGEDPLGFAAEMMPIYGEYSSYQQAQELSEQADQAEAAGDTESAKMLRQLSTVSMAGAIPLLGMFARGGKKFVMAGARGIPQIDEAGIAARIAELPEPADVGGYNGPEVASSLMEGDPVGDLFNREIAADVDGAVAAYKQIPKTKGGKIIDADQFRELSPEYRENRGLAPNVHEPASALSKVYFTRLLDETRGQEGNWIFTGGGPASGKSAAVSDAMEDAAQGVVDGTMGNYRKVIQQVSRVLEDPTKTATLVYIDREPLKAFNLALKRAADMETELGTGRTIPAKAFIDMHVDSRKAIREINEAFKDNPKVSLQIWDNNGGYGDQFQTTIDTVKDFDYNDTAERIMQRLEDAYENGEISENVYRGFKSGPDPRATGASRQDVAANSRVNEELGQRATQGDAIDSPRGAL